MQDPSPKEVVLALMSFVGKEKREITDISTGRQVEKVYVQYQCPKRSCALSVVSFIDKTGFNNPYGHLKRCYAKGHTSEKQEITLNLMYQEALSTAQEKGGTIKSHFASLSLSEYEKTVYAYLRMIIMKSLPLYYVDDAEVRKFSRFSVALCCKTVTGFIFELVELVENRIACEMEGTIRALLHDGWSCSGVHYVAAIASYCTTSTTAHLNSGVTVQHTPRLVLLGLSPLGKVDDVDSTDRDSVEEATRFNAEAHLHYFRAILQFFGQNFDDWCVCFVADSTSTNRRLARMSGKPHVGCNSHKLNLEVNRMLDTHTDFFDTVESVHGTMRSATQLKNAAILRNLTELRPIMHNQTRWSGKVQMLRRFLQIRNELFAVSESADGNICVDTSIRFEGKVKRYNKMLSEIDVVTKSLQIRGHTLSSCRQDLDVLIETVAAERSKRRSVFYQCKLGTHYIAPSAAAMVPDPLLESGVLKIQRGRSNDLSEEERDAVSTLKAKSMNEIVTRVGEDMSTETPSMVKRLAKRRKTGGRKEDYVNCDFIMGSVAEVERLWSIAKYVLTENRRRMTPQLFEALVFLKVNNRFWDAELVCKAITGNRSENAKARMRDHEINVEMSYSV